MKKSVKMWGVFCDIKGILPNIFANRSDADASARRLRIGIRGKIEVRPVTVSWEEKRKVRK